MKNSPGSVVGLLARRSPNPKLRPAGIVLALAGAAMVIFSFFSWASAEDELLSAGVTGMGSVSIEGGFGSGSGELEQILQDNSKSPGISTVVFGVLLIGAAVLLILNRFPGVAAVLATVLALLATVRVLFFLFDPADALIENAGDLPIDDVGWGLWLVALGSVVALAASGWAVVLTLRPQAAPASTGL
jgi:hypothetical protein